MTNCERGLNDPEAEGCYPSFRADVSQRDYEMFPKCGHYTTRSCWIPEHWATSKPLVVRQPIMLVFVGQVGQHMDASALRRRYANAAKSAELRPLPFHSLRHYFGSMAVNRATLVQVQAWMGHAHIQTTARYLHAKSQADDAALLAGAFAPSTTGALRVTTSIVSD
jgi:hypothetical protein